MFLFGASFSYAGCQTKVKEPSVPNFLPLAREEIVGLIPIPRRLALWEMQTGTSRVRTRVVVCIFSDYNNHTPIYIYIYIYTNLSTRPDVTQSQFLSGVQQVGISFSSASWVTKVEETSLPDYVTIAGGRIIGFIPFPMVLVVCEKKSVSSRIWTRKLPTTVIYIYIYIYIERERERITKRANDSELCRRSVTWNLGR